MIRRSILLFILFAFFAYSECSRRDYIQSRVHLANRRRTKIGSLILRSSTCKCKISEEPTQRLRTDDLRQKFDGDKNSTTKMDTTIIFGRNPDSNDNATTTATTSTTMQSPHDCSKRCHCVDVGCPCDCGSQCKELTSTTTTATLPKPQCKCVTFVMSCFICPCISACNPVPANQCPCAVDNSRPYACSEQFTQHIFDALSDDTVQLARLYQLGYRLFDKLNVTSPCPGDGSLNILPNSYASYQPPSTVPPLTSSGEYQVPPGTQPSDHNVHPLPYSGQYSSGPSQRAQHPTEQYVVSTPQPTPYVAPLVQPQPYIPQPAGYVTPPNLTGPTINTSPPISESLNASPKTVISSILVCFVFIVAATGFFSL